MEATDTGSFGKERAVVSLLRLTALREAESARVSELTVERFVGSALSGIFNLSKCSVISGLKLNFPDFLRPTKAFAFPDIATLREGDHGNYLSPVAIIGEGKIRERGLRKANAVPHKLSSSPNVRAQIALALHPTMILLVIAHYDKIHIAEPSRSLDEIQHPKPTQKPNFGAESMIYGIYYNDVEVVIFAHFPQIVEKVSGHTAETCVRFFQVPVARFPLKTGNLLERWRMVIALFVVQRHGQHLVEFLTPFVGKYSLSANDLALS
ncbi:hypothetical protein B0H12DRAFT_1149235 [Mycena haematopus]|nr:hypothetical protein B0H12DRAFT_1149235 [Mycena haematopus]